MLFVVVVVVVVSLCSPSFVADVIIAIVVDDVPNVLAFVAAVVVG